LYELFDLPEHASTIEIKRAYKKLAVKYHPDKLSCIDDDDLKASSEHELIRINNAKDILLNEEKRAEYDTLLQELRSSANSTGASDELIVELDIPDGSDLDVEWDADSFSEATEESTEDATGTTAEVDDTTATYESNMPTYDPRPVQTPAPIPRAPAPAFSTIQRRFSTFCPKCGEENLSGGPFCIVCHTALDPSQPRTIPVDPVSRIPAQGYPSPIPPRIKCPRCGINNLSNSQFCRNCNLNLTYLHAQFQQRSPTRAAAPNLYSYPPPPPPTSTPTTQPTPPPNQRPVRTEKTINRGRIPCPRCGAFNLKSRDNCELCNASLKSMHSQHNEQSISEVTNPHTNTEEPSNIQAISCPRCGAQNLSNSEFCSGCNLNLKPYLKPMPNVPYDPTPEQVQTTPEPHKIECPHCGAMTSTDSECCQSCFKNLIRNKYYSPRKFPQSPSKPEVEIRNLGLQRCPRCSAPVHPQQRVCNNCGVAFQ
jgi:hypothetical protein